MKQRAVGVLRVLFSMTFIAFLMAGGPWVSHAAPRVFSIEVLEADWGGSAPVDIGAVVRSVAQCFEGSLSERPTEPVLVEPTPPGQVNPISLYKRTAAGQVRVLLTSRGYFWSQFAYQFAHELCHVQANFCEPDHTVSKWIEESLCETASLFALRRMGVLWAENPPYPNWKSYAPELPKYVTDRCADPNRRLPPGVSFADWMTAHIPLLQADSFRRDDNTIIAQQLLPIFEMYPDAWRAVRYLNLWDAGRDLSVRDFCRHWKEACPEKLRFFVDALEHGLTGR